MEPSTKRRKLMPKEPPTRSIFAIPGATNEYRHVCIVNPDAPDRIVRLIALAEQLNVPIPYDRRYKDGVNANELCQRISAAITPSIFSSLPRELIEEIQLRLPARSAQAMRIAIPGALEQKPTTIQWLSRYRDPLSKIGLNAFIDTDNGVMVIPGADPAPVIRFFDDDNARSALDYMLAEYPDYFLSPKDAIIPGSNGEQFAYSFLPGQPEIFHTQPSLAFLHALRDEYARQRAKQRLPGRVIIPIWAVRFPNPPSHPALDPTQETLNANRRLSIMHIVLQINENGQADIIQEYPASCTLGLYDVLRYLKQFYGDNYGQFFDQITSRLGNYEPALKQIKPQAWQTGRYHPPPLLPDMLLPEYVVSLALPSENADINMTTTQQRWIDYFDRWTRQGYALMIPQGSIQDLTHLSCFSRYQIASAFLKLISALRVFRWNTLTEHDKGMLIRSSMQRFADGFNRWSAHPEQFSHKNDDIYTIALALLLVRDIYKFPEYNPQYSSFKDVMNMLTPQL